MRAQNEVLSWVVSGVAVLLVVAVAGWTTVPALAEPPLVEAPVVTITAEFSGAASCLPGWTLVDAETVWRLPYIPGTSWAFTDATEAELRAAYTRLDGTVDESRLEAAQGRLRELVRVTCRFAPLVPRSTGVAD